MTDSIAPTAFGLPDVPGQELDHYLDAAARCFARHGLGRTRVTDIADEVGVSRVTVYRQVGTVEQAARLLLSRDLDRMLNALLPKLVAAETPDDVISVIANAVEFAVEHPVLSKLLRDEPDLVGAFAIAELDVLLERLALLAEPVVHRLEALGTERDVDLVVLADWVARVVVTLVVAPPPGSVDDYLRAALGPVLG